MSPPGLLRAFVRRDWINESTYRTTLVVEVLGAISALVMFYSIGRLVGDQPESLRQYGGEYFPFALVGLAVSGFFSISLGTFSNRLRQAQAVGTLEAMLVTATPAPLILLFSGAWDLLLASVRFAAFVGIGMLLLGVRFDVNVLSLIPLAVLSLVTFIASGLIVASLILVVKRGESITTVGTIFGSVFGGVVFPVSLLPNSLRPVSYLVPLNYSLDGLRQATLAGADPGEVAAPLIALGILSALLVPVACIAIQWALRKTKREGSLGQY